MSGNALRKNSGAAPDRHSCGFGKRRRAATANVVCVVGVGEAVPDQPC
jgi:hypothetical protein